MNADTRLGPWPLQRRRSGAKGLVCGSSTTRSPARRTRPTRPFASADRGRPVTAPERRLSMASPGDCSFEGEDVGAFSASSAGASSLYITGVTKRAIIVLEINPPMITHASGE